MVIVTVVLIALFADCSALVNHHKYLTDYEQADNERS